MVCPSCQSPITAFDKVCPKCNSVVPSTMSTSWPPPAAPYGVYSDNTSGTGSFAQLPVELKGFNWGAFLNPFWWSIFNKTWLGLLVLVPYIGFVMAFVLGFKGNEWAWQNRRFDSIENFKTVQRIWMIWGVCLLAVSVVFYGIIFAIGGMSRMTSYMLPHP